MKKGENKVLETIVSWIVSVVAELLDAVVTAFLGMMNLDLGSISDSFPALTTGYRIFQALGVGLIILIAVVQLFKFFVGQLAEMQDTPPRILVRSAIAAMLIWFGGHFVELAVDLAKIPYDIFTDYDATATNMTLGMTFTEMSENLGDMNLIDGVTLTLGAPALLVLTLIVLLLVGWNILKLLLEVCERFLMLGVLAYASPLIYPTLASQPTSEIFRRWVNMFAGQCAIMTISAWMLKVIISGFSFQETDTNILFRIVLTLALCKIAQRVDTYMQQLGIGVATTGGNLVDELIGLGAVFSGGRRRGHHSSGGDGKDSPVLGAGPDGSLSRVGGLLGGIANTAQRAAQRYRDGTPMSEVGANLGKDFLTGMGMSKGAKTIKDAVTNKDISGAKQAAQVAKGVAQAVGGTAVAGAPLNTVRKFQAARDEARRETVQNAYAGSEDFNRRSKDSRYQPPQGEKNTNQFDDPDGSGYDNSENMSGVNEEVKTAQQAAMQTASQFFASQRAAHGVGGYEVDDDGDVTLDTTAQKAGLRLNLGEDDPMVEGRDDVVGDFIAKNYQEMADNEDMQEYALNTVRSASPLAAEQALNNPYCTLEGNDELGDALIKKAYGEQTITGKADDELGGKFQNIRAESVGENGRIIHADYVGKDGVTVHYDIQNAEALNEAPVAAKLRQFADGVAQKTTTVEGAGSGVKMHVRKPDFIGTRDEQGERDGFGSGDKPKERGFGFADQSKKQGFESDDKPKGRGPGDKRL